MFRKALVVCAAVAVSATAGISSASANLTLTEPAPEANYALAQATPAHPSKAMPAHAKSTRHTAVRKYVPSRVATLNNSRPYRIYIHGVTY
jgi:hypothetical protein